MFRFLVAVITLISLASAGLTARTLPDSILVIPAGVREIPDYGYSERTDIREIRIEGNSLRKIGRSAFAWCTSLRSVTLPQGLEDIASQAFAYCGNLTEINIPSSVKHIGANTFSFCSSLPSVVLPANLIELESYVFSECTALKEATLPANRNMLGEMIFAGCYNLRLLKAPSALPPVFDCNSAPFDPEEKFMYDRCELLVPAGAADAYRKAGGWKNFHHIVAGGI